MDIYRQILWHFDVVTLWFTVRQALCGVVVLWHLQGWLVSQLQTGHFREKVPMLGTEKASHLFFSAQSICEDNGERKRYKKTVHFRVEIARQTRDLDKVLTSTGLSPTECWTVVKVIFYITKQELSKFFCDAMHCHINYVFNCSVFEWAQLLRDFIVCYHAKQTLCHF